MTRLLIDLDGRRPSAHRRRAVQSLSQRSRKLFVTNNVA